MELKVQLKQAGKKGSSIETGRLIFERPPKTVEELLTMTVKACLNNFRNKKSGEVLLNQEQIEDMSVSGKIGFGIVEGNRDIKDEEAIANTLQSFEDGMVALFIDDKRYEELDAKLALSGEETLTFVKLILLAGRMW